ncbi:hypothetical protein ACA910_016860 [Epithemia clementina (nom. ined.)]
MEFLVDLEFQVHYFCYDLGFLAGLEFWVDLKLWFDFSWNELATLVDLELQVHYPMDGLESRVDLEFWVA